MSKVTTNQEQIAVQEASPLSFGIGLCFFVVVLSLILLGGWRLFDRMMANEAAPIATVQVEGEMPFTNKSDISKALSASNLGNFFQLNVNQVQQSLESLPWVKSASVRKQWPNQLSLYIVDHQPVAIWNEKQMLSKAGVVFEADQSRVPFQLPSFTGPVGAEAVALENFNHLNELLSLGDLGIAEISLSERYAWRLKLSDGVELHLGREERIERIQRFIEIYPQILEHKNENQQVNYVDLRYDTGVAVGWKQAEDKRV